MSEQNLMSHSTCNRSFRRRVFPGIWFHWYWQPSHKIKRKCAKSTKAIPNTNRLTLVQKNIHAKPTSKPTDPSSPVRTAHTTLLMTAYCVTQKSFDNLPSHSPDSSRMTAQMLFIEQKAEKWSGCRSRGRSKNLHRQKNLYIQGGPRKLAHHFCTP